MTGPEEGELAVRIAREAIDRALRSPDRTDPALGFRDRELPPTFDEARGVFVTLHGLRNGSLRGCIGYPLPVYPLRVALPRVAVAAAVEDPRFPAVKHGELESLLLEISLLSVPERIEVEPRSCLPGEIRVGRDGLIVDGRGSSGLLLPQVAVQQGWGSEEFLRETCTKGGLSPNAWRSPDVQVRRFTAERFRELRPGGPVVTEGASEPSAPSSA